ncbi:hypothetical protein T440DRAFT_305753 [Plenodomus tracheiphilus IPT5]|uniref:Spherulation-specific family 4 n=1 Tax=Plenodomus tracheiphilus IPT5 TaxID=1408161 RepID=A0A6A7BDH5_9PLEO|nr:hypothetical protein T440DRAFT_305753 [Plenodomus tracheiphilus IPT5]
MVASVLVPLYVYPSLGAWDPFYEMASLHPQMQFTAVVNVQSGPGNGALPNQEYSKAIEALNSFHNVRTVGYVSTTWCTRNVSAVLDEIYAYAFWGEYDSTLALHGIFVDETPTRYSPEHVSYLQNIAQVIHDSTGLKGGYVVHNPGALPEPQYFDSTTFTGPDLTIVFENSFSKWMDEGVALANAARLYEPRKLALVVHSVPDLSTIETELILRQLLAVGECVWLTGTASYTELDAVLFSFIDSLVELLNQVWAH